MVTTDALKLMALIKRIVEAQGGRGGISSVVGQGSVFHAVFPTQIGNGTHAQAASLIASEPG